MDHREQKKLGAKSEKDIPDRDKAEAWRFNDDAMKRFDKKLEEMTERDWRIFKEDLNISYEGSKIPKPMRSWVESGLSRTILKAVDRAGYKKPSPIQMAAISLGLQQIDVIGVAETGSGVKISQGCAVLIATPGRDCLKSRYIVLNQCNYVVLDEADHMIDIGMEKEVGRILDAMPSSNLKLENEEELDDIKIYRTTYMFNATMRTDVERLARRYLRNPVMVVV
nr:hypothetical protein [Tanacetum cinerariifolium]